MIISVECSRDGTMISICSNHSRQLYNFQKSPQHIPTRFRSRVINTKQKKESATLHVCDIRTLFGKF